MKESIAKNSYEPVDPDPHAQSLLCSVLLWLYDQFLLNSLAPGRS